MNEANCSVTNGNPIHRLNNELRPKRSNLSRSSGSQNNGCTTLSATTIERIFTNSQRGNIANKIDFQNASPVAQVQAEAYYGGDGGEGKLSRPENQWSKEFSWSYKNKSIDVVMPGRMKNEKYSIGFHDKVFTPYRNEAYRLNHLYPYGKTYGGCSSASNGHWETQFELIEDQLISELKIAKKVEQTPIGYDYLAEYEETIDFKYTSLPVPETYQFLNNNDYSCQPDPYKIGCILMENGSNLNEVVKAFEAAISQDPSHVNAWLKLGIVSIENENENNGELALQNCLNLDPNNTSAMESLAIHYTNQQNESEAMKLFQRWILSKFSEYLYPTVGQNNKFMDTTLGKSNLMSILESLLKMRVTKKDQRKIHSVLSVLYYSDQKIRQSLESLEFLLSEKPNDEIIWNRYGAILANTKSYHSAINAYNKSKLLRPNFTRARYNLAIAFLSNGDYIKASKTLIEIILLQSKGIENIKTKMHNKFMQNLKNALIALKKFDLLDDLVNNSDEAELLISTLKIIYNKIG
ncbi:hypothetical protein SEUBUCD650_0M01580 [Saccharomyces eubayanus]|uniref:Uncharacterized protein n=1 Tax=Saccharomyces eubayanus TaxID=1080349 RepID=A0ABN8VI34_SACEU|nr:hypothetical protein SEUBUCD650_0M01580 [Saccharomyces eubayanus]